MKGRGLERSAGPFVRDGTCHNAGFRGPPGALRLQLTTLKIRGTVRRALKFLHTMGAIGLMGSMACLIVLMSVTPPPGSLAGYALMHGAMGAIATWIFFPSLALTLIPGLLSLAVNRAFHNAGWAWAKLATTLLILEGSFVYILGPMQEEATRSAAALAGRLAPAALTGSYGAEQKSLWVMLAVATANVVLGVWRPKLTRIPD